MKRFFDLVASFSGLLFSAPLFIVVMLFIKVSSPGPIFFRQTRVGREGLLFKVHKFRTMFDRADTMGTSITSGNDPRITPTGRILRRTKLDELPQLFNVFKGDMSLVGPRPEVPEIVAHYSPEMRRILSIKPGLTSVATLHLRDEEGFLAEVEDPDAFYEGVLAPLKVRLAMEHVERNSFWFDMKIGLQTVWMLTLGRLRPIQVHPEVLELKRRVGANRAREREA